MIAEKTDVQRLHFEHKLWMNELQFFADEIAIFEHRLEEVLQRHPGEKEALVRLEQFQNQFIRQKSVLEELQHDINIHEQTISGLLKSGFSTPEHKINDHSNIRENMDSFKSIYTDLKASFYAYILQWK
jgi:hypothetical protein